MYEMLTSVHEIQKSNHLICKIQRILNGNDTGKIVVVFLSIITMLQ